MDCAVRWQWTAQLQLQLQLDGKGRHNAMSARLALGMTKANAALKHKM
jgi:hypothetical protein